MESSKCFNFFPSKYCTLIIVTLVSCLLATSNSEKETLQKKELDQNLSEENKPKYKNIAQILGDLFNEESEDSDEYQRKEPQILAIIEDQKSDTINQTRKARTYKEVAAVSHTINRGHPHTSNHFYFRRRPQRRISKHERRHKKKAIRKWEWGNPKQKRKGTKNHNYKLQKPNTDIHYAVHTVG
ncbi:unnamed protein product [Orchesella dallaii]|uniref:Uncharacterized protein n=1 Tax=Orchesella dallaii TaxID=48710 RepID=A0ABP1PSX4_9HEXA